MKSKFARLDLKHNLEAEKGRMLPSTANQKPEFKRELSGRAEGGQWDP